MSKPVKYSFAALGLTDHNRAPCHEGISLALGSATVGQASYGGCFQATVPVAKPVCIQMRSTVVVLPMRRGGFVER